MRKIDTSDWSVIAVDVGGHIVIERVLDSEENERKFCEKYGFKLISFQKGTNPLCK